MPTEDLTAEQARELAFGKGALQKYLDEIRIAAAKGQLYITTDESLTMYTKDELKKRGFQLESRRRNIGTCDHGVSYFHITWKE